MPPKQRINRDMILNGAFQVFCREGMRNINARSVARELNCSTQPIFSYYSGMKELKDELEQLAYQRFTEAMGPAFSEEDPLHAVIMAYLGFASGEPMLFRYLFIETNSAVEGIGESRGLPKDLPERTARAYGMDVAHARELCLTMGAYSHGLASIMATGVLRIDGAEAKRQAEAVLSRERAALS